MEETYGIKETKELVTWLFDLSDAIISATGDGKISITDAPLFFKTAMKAGTGIGGINMVPKELTDLSEEETKEIHDMVKDRFDITDDKVEAYIENAFLSALQFFRNMSNIYTLARQ